ncbi:MAG: NAD+ synthase [Nitrospirota bacterium]
MRTMRIALAQINPTVGDLEGNVSKILKNIRRARKVGAHVIALPELAVPGYPPEDLLLKTQFIEDNLEALDEVRKNVEDIIAIVGFVDKKDDIYNAAAIIYNKEIIDIYHKMYLPNYGVFDEFRYFQVGTRCPIYRVGSIWVGVSICEDIWYPDGPARTQSLAGAEIIFNINASPYHIGKGKFREQMLSTRASDNIVIVAYLNTVGGQDELVFDGHSVVLDQNGRLVARGKQFHEDLIIVDLETEGVMMRRLHAPLRRSQAIKLEKGVVEKIDIPVSGTFFKKTPQKVRIPSRENRVLDGTEEVYTALVLGTSDYVRKNGFDRVVMGLSGGIDSSLVASIAVDALGKENVTGLFMPSPYTSKESKEDVFDLAHNLDIKVIEIPIDRMFRCYLDSLRDQFQELKQDETEENIQARIRGNILMALSNKFGWLVLTTGNKSEMSVGYATLYGDMAGGFAVIKDVPKTMVYELCRWKNSKAGTPVIPERVLVKEPSAELKPGQKDTDTLPPYNILDQILKAYIEDDKSFKEILSMGFGRETAARIIKMIDRSEYKRRQSPPGIKITPRALGRDRRFPITNKYKGH